MEKEKNFWCFQCNKTYPKREITILSDESLQCKVCNSTFIEEINENEDSQPKDFVPVKFQNNQGYESRSIHYFQSRTFNIPGFNPITISIGNDPRELESIITNNTFFHNPINFSLENNNNIFTFLNSHNDDEQFENLLNFIMTHDPNHYGNPPASENAIQALKKITIDNSNINNEKESTCNICFCNYEIGEKCIIMPCSHQFHEECIIKWLQMHNSCPICRYELESNDADYEQRKNHHREILRNYNNNFQGNNGNSNQGGNHA